MDTQNKSNGIGKRSTLALSFTAKKCIPAKLSRASNNVLNCHRDFRADVFKPLILSNPGPTASIIYSSRRAQKKQTLVVTSLIFTEKRLGLILASCEVTKFIGGLTYTQRTYMCVHCAHSRWFLMVSSSAVAMAPVTHRWDMRAPPPPSSLWRPQHGDTLNT